MQEQNGRTTKMNTIFNGGGAKKKDQALTARQDMIY